MEAVQRAFHPSESGLDGVAVGDPNEMQNLYSDPEYADVINDLKDRLKSTRKELNETDERYPHINEIIEKNWNK